MGCQLQEELPATVLGELNYLLDQGVRPVNYARPEPGQPRYSGVFQSTAVTLRNARLLEPAPSLDVQGFQLLQQGSGVADLQDEQQVVERYYPEVIALLKARLGAGEVVIFDHTIRVDEAGREEAGLREPVRYVHNDQTERAAIRRVQDHLPAQEAQRRLQGRFAIINVWRPIDHPVYGTPLALCDARSMDDADLLPTDLVYPDKVGETFSVRANPAHRWYYYPEQRPDEVLLLKIYDSRKDVARLSAHTAFDDPNTPAGAPPRKSIEVRTLVFYGD